ncbi:hypothetical protein SPRG_04417 [Saprolegnia parasitica CBS 223.65]|uniref:Uncharacterized protein n=1 Tax=Saprolegnia parasitica (strain CBS 223.65) TaxID=695850 RepID=A0A067CVF2_SAPPC|nr:hypothetical protein SPRG_04417 [Saprolegnia parasitica CBS 223.65]KDO30516.1 hypothetical protein SPRG_04417 [Saprolegnia parasitica CBS 223.65]|eukprot:XP_012198731.1 hypothetical protein SPRG_04417 [Saprolegnia parasitica CBS 223.65]
MVVYYTRKYSSVLDKVGWRRSFIALEVHPDVGVLVVLNTNAHYPLDTIVRVQWHTNLKALIELPEDDRLCVKFETPDALKAFLFHLSVCPETDSRGNIAPGIYVNPALGHSKHEAALATLVLGSMRSWKAHRLGRKDRSGSHTSASSRTSNPGWVVA